MKLPRTVLMLVGAAATLLYPALLHAADPNAASTPIVVPQDAQKKDLAQTLRGVPENVKTLIVTFDQTRDKYLQQQQVLLAKMRHAVTADEQAQVRQQLQANRQEFLSQLKGFRDELRTDLQALKGKISHAEFGRVIDAAHGASAENGHRHRGQ